MGEASCVATGGTCSLLKAHTCPCHLCLKNPVPVRPIVVRWHLCICVPVDERTRTPTQFGKLSRLSAWKRSLIRRSFVIATPSINERCMVPRSLKRPQRALRNLNEPSVNERRMVLLGQYISSSLSFMRVRGWCSTRWHHTMIFSSSRARSLASYYTTCLPYAHHFQSIPSFPNVRCIATQSTEGQLDPNSPPMDSYFA